MKFLKHRIRNSNNGSILEDEPILEEIKFNKFKFNNKIAPTNKKNILFITCFSEFGCESLALMYCIPYILKSYNNNNLYVICVGWHGRDYLYSHLVDEFWSIKEEYQWLREYSLAFRTTSKNIISLEKSLSELGNLFKGEYMANVCLGNKCRICSHYWGEGKYGCSCPKCHSSEVDRGILNDVHFHKKNAKKIPLPSNKSVDAIGKYLLPNSVGIFARNRASYGRNLSSSFYIKLIDFLKNKGYNPIWLGERQSTLSCPCDDITDFSSTKDADNLELTLALLSKLEFTVQFWTASTRLASMVGTPWILFETPDQIVGHGQEGIRIALTSDFDKKKLVLAQYKNVLEDENLAIKYLDKAIDEIKSNNWKDIIGPVEDADLIRAMLEKQKLWVDYELSS